MHLLEDDRAAEAHHFAPLAEPIDEKAVQVVEVRDRDVDEEVLVAGDYEDRDHLGHVRGRRLKAIDHPSLQRADLHRDQRLHSAVERAEIDIGTEAADHSTLEQAPDPLQTGGRSYANPPGQFAVALPRICL